MKEQAYLTDDFIQALWPCRDLPDFVDYNVSHFQGTGTLTHETVPSVKLFGFPRNFDVPKVSAKSRCRCPRAAATFGTVHGWILDMRGYRPQNKIQACN